MSLNLETLRYLSIFRNGSPKARFGQTSWKGTFVWAARHIPCGWDRIHRGQ